MVCPPNVFYSHQTPRSGEGFAGVNIFNDTTVWYKDNNREYIEVPLDTPLIANRTYCLRFYTSKGDNCMWATKNIQLAFANSAFYYYDASFNYINSLSPAIEANLIVEDTINWTKVEGTYLANGGEKYILLGNFLPGDSVTRKLVLPYSMGTTAYYYFDDISIYEQPDFNAGTDTTICPWHSTVLGPTSIRSDVSYSWSPTAGLDNPNIANPTANPLVNTTYFLTITDTNQLACSSVLTDSIKITVSGCVGITENIETFNFNIYPNPSKDFFNVETNVLNYTVFIRDIYGRSVMNITLTRPRTEISSNALSNGVYYLTYGNQTKKLIIQK
jgi:hypothetical protein